MSRSFQNTNLLIVVFFAIALCAYAISAFALQSIPETGYAYLASLAIPFDLMIVVPAAFYLLIIRKNKLSPLLLLPVISLGSLFVFQIAKPDNLMVVFVIAALMVAVELTIALRVLAKLVRVFKEAKQASSDPSAWFLSLSREFIPFHRIATLLASELSTIYYAFFSWKKQALIPQNSEPFSYHKSGYISMMVVITCLMPVEIVPVHILVSQWSPVVATVLSALSLYAILWLIGDCRASILRPITVSDDTITINSAIRFSAHIPLSSIESMGSKGPHLPKEKVINMGIMGSPNVWLVFSHDIKTSTLLGGAKQTRAIGLSVDDASRLRATLADRAKQVRE